MFNLKTEFKNIATRRTHRTIYSAWDCTNYFL